MKSVCDLKHAAREPYVARHNRLCDPHLSQKLTKW
jgi:hypothetical protein